MTPPDSYIESCRLLEMFKSNLEMLEQQTVHAAIAPNFLDEQTTQYAQLKNAYREQQDAFAKLVMKLPCTHLRADGRRVAVRARALTEPVASFLETFARQNIKTQIGRNDGKLASEVTPKRPESCYSLFSTTTEKEHGKPVVLSEATHKLLQAVQEGDCEFSVLQDLQKKINKAVSSRQKYDKEMLFTTHAADFLNSEKAVEQRTQMSEDQPGYDGLVMLLPEGDKVMTQVSTDFGLVYRRVIDAGKLFSIAQTRRWLFCSSFCGIRTASCSSSLPVEPNGRSMKKQRSTHSRSRRLSGRSKS
jgi:hypothetical protein